MKYYTIQKPCREAWDAMTGDDSTRFCEQCRRSVYNFSMLTRREVERLSESAEGRICGRITYGTEGVPQSRPEPPSALGQVVRVSLLGLAGLHVAAAAGAGQDKKCQVKVVATDVTGSALAHATVSVFKEGKTIEQGNTNDQGLYMVSLAEGRYSIEVEALGFSRLKKDDVTPSCSQGEGLQVDAELKVGELMGEVVIVDSNQNIFHRIGQKIRRGMNSLGRS